jgi:hypothetical protein
VWEARVKGTDTCSSLSVSSDSGHLCGVNSPVSWDSPASGPLQNVQPGPEVCADGQQVREELYSTSTAASTPTADSELNPRGAREIHVHSLYINVDRHIYTHILHVNIRMNLYRIVLNRICNFWMHPSQQNLTFFLMVLGIELRALNLLSKSPTT